eukprot:CAMPEP_0201555572 /NCGR_PEP_ID=MMETSP0173_2-20130828/49846_1 /ASSEMBLY_ACC=CAM_ASM_000268 /TAXON_ID=218659 /ORGANISM="Vexillifera sp., Strain DIVA3 564/2" /LENGTH=297 /DNA_ID=CAMNT_0047967429 /DNA_START=374 /DNA_END=1264 /DNA_ORIENTATION=+
MIVTLQSRLEESQQQTTNTFTQHHAQMTDAFELTQVVDQFIERAQTFRQQLVQAVVAQDEVIFQPNSSDDHPRLSLECQPLVNSDAQVKSLRALISDFIKAAPTSQFPFEQTLRLAASLREQSEQLVFVAMIAFVKEQLARLPLLHQWASTGASSSTSAQEMGAPSPYINLIKEYVLSLPEQIEKFAPTDNTDDEASIEFVYRWISTLLHATVKLFAKRILEIQALGEFGKQQLLVDIHHMENLLKALDFQLPEQIQAIQMYFMGEEQKNEVLEKIKPILQKMEGQSISGNGTTMDI